MLFSLKTADCFYRAAEFIRWNGGRCCSAVRYRRYIRAADYLMARWKRRELRS